MDHEEARERFAQARVCRLATVTPQGAPHVVPAVFALVGTPAGDVAYTAVDGKPKTTTALQRLANIAGNDRASLLVDAYQEDWSTLWWVRFDGAATVLPAASAEAGTALDALAARYPQYLETPLPGPVIAVRLTRWRWWSASPA